MPSTSTDVIPHLKLTHLSSAIAEAYTLAEEGDLCEGFAALATGADRARREYPGERWGPDLVDRWQWVCDRYLACYPPAAVEPAGPPPPHGLPRALLPGKPLTAVAPAAGPAPLWAAAWAVRTVAHGF